MPRPVNTGRLQSAFGQLGQANSLQTNRLLQQRESDRQDKASTGALIGGIIGSKFGPAGAAAGSAIGSKIAGGRVSQGQAANVGVALAQANQETPEERQQNAALELQQAGQGQQQMQQDFDTAFQPVSTDPQQVANEQGQPKPFIPFKDEPQVPLAPLPDGSQPAFEQAFQSTQGVPEMVFPNQQGINETSAPVPVPTEGQVQQARAMDVQGRGSALNVAQPGSRSLDTQSGGALQNFMNNQQNQLVQGRQLLNQPGLSPDAFSLQKSRVDKMQGEADRTQQQAAFLREKQRGSERLAIGKIVADKKGLSQKDVEALEVSANLKGLGLLYEGQSEKIADKIISSVKKGRTDAISFMTQIKTDPLIRRHGIVKDNFDKMKAIIAGNPSKGTPGGDVSLVYQLMKINDPGSTVMQGEQATAKNAGGAFDKYGNIYNRLMGGGSLSKTQRADFLKTAKKLTLSSEAEYDRRMNGYRKSAKSIGVPIDVIMDLGRVDNSFVRGDNNFNIKNYPKSQRAEINKNLSLIGSKSRSGKVITREMIEAAIRKKYGK